MVIQFIFHVRSDLPIQICAPKQIGATELDRLVALLRAQRDILMEEEDAPLPAPPAAEEVNDGR